MSPNFFSRHREICNHSQFVISGIYFHIFVSCTCNDNDDTSTFIIPGFNFSVFEDKTNVTSSSSSSSSRLRLLEEDEEENSRIAHLDHGARFGEFFWL